MRVSPAPDSTGGSIVAEASGPPATASGGWTPRGRPRRRRRRRRRRGRGRPRRRPCPWRRPSRAPWTRSERGREPLPLSVAGPRRRGSRWDVQYIEPRHTVVPCLGPASRKAVSLETHLESMVCLTSASCSVTRVVSCDDSFYDAPGQASWILSFHATVELGLWMQSYVQAGLAKLQEQ